MRYYTCDILRNLKITSRLPLSLPLTALWNNHYKLLHIEACSSKKFHYYCLKYCSAKHFVANIPYSLHWNCLFQRGSGFHKYLGKESRKRIASIFDETFTKHYIATQLHISWLPRKLG